MVSKGFRNVSLKENLWKELQKIAIARHTAPTTIIHQVMWEYVDKWKGLNP